MQAARLSRLMELSSNSFPTCLHLRPRLRALLLLLQPAVLVLIRSLTCAGRLPRSSPGRASTCRSSSGLLTPCSRLHAFRRSTNSISKRYTAIKPIHSVRVAFQHLVRQSSRNSATNTRPFPPDLIKNNA